MITALQMGTSLPGTRASGIGHLVSAGGFKGFGCAVLIVMAIRPGLRLELWLSLALAALVVAISFSRNGVMKHHDRAQTDDRVSAR